MLEVVDAPSDSRVIDGRDVHPAPEPDEADRIQIAERLHWAPKERLQYLLDMLAFEERARHARPLDVKR